MADAAWHIVTGEYPPQPGGVGDYTAQLAAALAERGSEVHVWTSGEGPATSGVSVHRLAGSWSRADLARLDAALDAFRAPRRILAQHVPALWGYQGMNLVFGRWLLRRRLLGDDVRVMFHEVRYHTRLFDKPTRWLLGGAQWLLVRDILAASTQVYVSTPSWEPLLRRHGAPGRAVWVTWLPVPSNVPVVADPEGVAALRRRLVPDGARLIGTFGTYSGAVAALLASSLPPLVRDHPGRHALLLGRGGERFAARLAARHPSLAARLHAPGALPADEVSRHLQASDLLLQPYPDGVTSRRTSTMAALAHGRAVVTNAGALTEPLWADSAAVALAPDAAALVGAAECVLSDPGRCAGLGAEARRLYERSFAIGRTVAMLLDSVREPAGHPA